MALVKPLDAFCPFPHPCMPLPSSLPACPALACPALPCLHLLQEEQERAAALQPYRVAAPKRGVMGSSRYAQALRRAIVQASRDKTR